MTTQHDELQRLASEEPLFTGPPDLIAIRHSGRRLRTRRRIATGIASVAVVAAVGVPVGLSAGNGTESSPPVGPAGATHHTRTDVPSYPTSAPLPDDCVSLGCVGDSAVETGEVVGEPWLLGISADGTEEVVYAVRPTAGSGLFVATGLRTPDGLRRLALVFEPGHEPGQEKVHLAGGQIQRGGGASWYSTVGLVDYETGTIARQSSVDGVWRNVNRTTDLVPGHTVFLLAGTWDDSWDPQAPAPVSVRVSGETYPR